MTSTLGAQQQVNEQGLYQASHQPIIGKDNLSQKYEFDSPNTIAKQSQFQQAGGQQQWAGQQGFGGQQGLQSGSLQAPPLPQARTRQPRRQINLRTRDWQNQPWNHQGQGQGQLGGETYRPPAALLGGSSWGGQQLQQQPSSSLPPLHPSAASGLPSSNYQPSSTIPLSHNYQLPHSQLANSSVPQQQAAPTAQLNKNYLPGNTLGNNSLNANNFGNNSTLGNNTLGNNTLGNNSFGNNTLGNNNLGNNSFGNNNTLGNNSFGGIPNAPAFTGFRRGGYRSSRGRQMRPLRTRNWGTRSENGWSGFNNQNAVGESFLQNRQRFAPDAPRMAPFGRQRQWQRGPYRQRPLRTRHWGIRSENGWSKFNSGIYAHEAALPFNNRNRGLNWADQSGNQGLNQGINQTGLNQGLNQGINQSGLNQGYNQGLNQGYNQGYSQGLNNTNGSYIPVQNQGMAPVAALAPLTGGNRKLSKRATRRQARKNAKQASIAQQLNTQINPPIGDPAVNHYRRGAPAAVPIVGSAPGGQASSTGGKLSSRRRGRRNNLGHRRGRTQQNTLPVPATQPPFVAPVAAAPLVAAPITTTNLAGTTYPPATYRTVHNNASIANNSGFVNQPTTAFRPAVGTTQGLSSSSATPISNSGTFSQAGSGIGQSSGVSGPLYTQGALQQRPLSNTLGGSTGQSSNLPLYSAHEPVAASILDKRAQAPVASNTRGSATF